MRDPAALADHAADPDEVFAPWVNGVAAYYGGYGLSGESVDVLASLSRLMPSLATPTHQEHARRLREALARWNEGRDLIEIGAYKPGTNAALDHAVAILPGIEAFLRQSTEDSTGFADTCALLGQLFGREGEA